MKYIFIITSAVLWTVPNAVRAETLRVITPYLGEIENEYVNPAYRLDIRDDGPLRGVHAQWINTGRFQANIFCYRAPEVNYSDVQGLHANLDYYFGKTAGGKWVIGGGLEDVRVEMAAGANISGLSAFDMDNEILFGYLRAGRYFDMGRGPFKASLMPYAGWAFERVSGDIYMDVSGPVPPRSVSLDGNNDHPLGGVNLRLSLWHFADLQAKWMGRFKDGPALHSYSLMANLYLSRNWGLSYNWKYMEYGNSSNEYGMAGLIYIF